MAEAILKNRETKAEKPPVDSNFRMIISDIDGTLTDNYMVIGSDVGEREKRFCMKDKEATIYLKNRFNIDTYLITSDHWGYTDHFYVNTCEALRCKPISEFNGTLDKWAAVRRFLDQQGVHPDQVIYVGNGGTDLQCMQNVGRAFYPNDAEIEEGEPLVTCGGHGVLREIYDVLVYEQENE